MERQVLIYYSGYCGNSTSLCLGFIFFLGGGGSTNLADSAVIPYRQALRTTRHVKLSHVAELASCFFSTALPLLFDRASCTLTLSLC